MRNFLFNFIAGIQPKLLAGIGVKKARFKDNSYFLLIGLPLPACNIVTILGRNMTISEHHITIPEQIKPNEKSEYHYTVIVNDKEKIYKLHVHFNAKDNIPREPALFEETVRGFTKRAPSLNEEDINTFLWLCASSISPVITQLRALQRSHIQSLCHQKILNEEALTLLSSNLAANQEKYLGLIAVQIELLNQLETLGYPLASAELNVYKLITASLMVEKSLSSSETQVKGTRLQAKKPSPSTPHKRTADVKEKPKKKPSPMQLRLAKIKDLLTTYLEKDDAAKLELTRKMLWALEDSHLLNVEYGSFVPSIELLELQIKLKQAIRDNLTKMDPLKNWDCYMEAYHKGIVKELDLTSLRQIFEKDDVTKLKLFLSPAIAETTSFKLTDQNLTLIEWAVHYQALECILCLLDNRFSLDYFVSKDNAGKMIVKHSPFFCKLLSVLSAKPYNTIIEQIIFAATPISLLEADLARTNQNTAEGKYKANVLTSKIQYCKLLREVAKVIRKSPIIQQKIIGSIVGQRLVMNMIFHDEKFSALEDDLEILQEKINEIEAYLVLLPKITHRTLFILGGESSKDKRNSKISMQSLDPERYKKHIIAILKWQEREHLFWADVIDSKLQYKVWEAKTLEFICNREKQHCDAHRLEYRQLKLGDDLIELVDNLETDIKEAESDAALSQWLQELSLIDEEIPLASDAPAPPALLFQAQGAAQPHGAPKPALPHEDHNAMLRSTGPGLMN